MSVHLEKYTRRRRVGCVVRKRIFTNLQQREWDRSVRCKRALVPCGARVWGYARQRVCAIENDNLPLSNCLCSNRIITVFSKGKSHITCVFIFVWYSWNERDKVTLVACTTNSPVTERVRLQRAKMRKNSFALLMKFSRKRFNQDTLPTWQGLLWYIRKRVSKLIHNVTR